MSIPSADYNNPGYNGSNNDDSDSSAAERIITAVVVLVAMVLFVGALKQCEARRTSSTTRPTPTTSNNGRPITTSMGPPAHNLLQTMTATERNSYVANVLNTKVSSRLVPNVIRSIF